MNYTWKDGSRLTADAQKVGERIEKLRVKRGGTVKPGDVVADGGNEKSPLHQYFEWDDSVAAERYREEQASYVLRHIMVRVETDDEYAEPKLVRAFVSYETEGDNVYTAVAVAMGDEAIRVQVLHRAWRELEGWKKRYREYEELAKVFSAMDEIAEKFEGSEAA